MPVALVSLKDIRAEVWALLCCTHVMLYHAALFRWFGDLEIEPTRRWLLPSGRSRLTTAVIAPAYHVGVGVYVSVGVPVGLALAVLTPTGADSEASRR